MRHTSLLYIMIIALTLSCSKTAQHPEGKSESEIKALLVGKWKIQELSTSLAVGEMPTVASSYKGVTGDYYEFTEEGKIHAHIAGKNDILDYRIEGNKIHISFHGYYTDIMDIQDITDNQLSLEYRNATDLRESISKKASFSR